MPRERSAVIFARARNFLSRCNFPSEIAPVSCPRISVNLKLGLCWFELSVNGTDHDAIKLTRAFQDILVLAAIFKDIVWEFP